MDITLSEIQQKDVWDGWLGSEARSLYFAELCNRYSRVQRRITWGLLAASSGATATVLTGLPDWFRFLLPLATAGLSLWSLVENNSKTATDTRTFTFGGASWRLSTRRCGMTCIPQMRGRDCPTYS